MKVEVKQEHIDKGQRNKCGLCPIALAIKEQYPQYCSVLVDYCTVDLFLKEWEGQEHDKRKILPLEAEEFVCNFDLGEAVQPFTFELI